MEDSYSQCERDPETGEVLDPVYYTPIPENRLIVVREGNGVWCMDALVLLKNMVLYRNTTNPLTRTELSADVLKQIEEYRIKQLRFVIVVDDAESVNSPRRSETLTFNSFDLIGDVIAQIALKGRSIVTLVLKMDNTSLYSLDLERDLMEFGTTIVLHSSVGSLTRSEYDKIKEFVGKFDRYKWNFSPFPAWTGETMRQPTTRAVRTTSRTEPLRWYTPESVGTGQAYDVSTYVPRSMRSSATSASTGQAYDVSGYVPRSMRQNATSASTGQAYDVSGYVPRSMRQSATSASTGQAYDVSTYVPR